MSTAVLDQVALEQQNLKEIRHNSIQNDRQTLKCSRAPNHDPFPDGAFEKLSRNNIWGVVLQHLDPASLTSAYSSCSTFRSLSEEPVLVQVLSLLKKTHSLYFKVRIRHDHTFSHWSNNHDIWNLRLVSKSWKRATEQVYMNQFSDPSWYVNYLSLSPCLLPMAQSIRYAPECEYASYALRGSDTVAQLQLCQVVLLSSECFYHTIFFLDNYGEQIQGVEFTNCLNVTEPVEIYRVLEEYLHRLPNLKWLVVNNYIWDRKSRDLNPLRDLILQYPLPTIPSLELIQFERRDENEFIMNELLRSNPQVKGLQLPQNFPVTQSTLLQMEKLDNLTAYNVQSAEVLNLSQITVLRHVNWPLKHLNIISTVFRVPTGTLLSLVNRFGSTLETLGLQLSSFDIKNRHRRRLDLPKLRKITFNEAKWESHVGLDFLLPSRSLEQIQFSCLRINNRNERRGKVFIGYRKTVEESNIWRWFPRLKCIRVKEQCGGGSRGMKEPVHYVRKGLSRVVRVSSNWDCEIICK